jgi:hypothetical protein
MPERIPAVCQIFFVARGHNTLGPLDEVRRLVEW